MAEIHELNGKLYLCATQTQYFFLSLKNKVGHIIMFMN